MPYCSNCGAQINQGVKFCSSCGNRIETSAQGNTPPPPSYQPAQTGEPVVAAISGLKKGILGRKNFIMLITSQKLVFTELTGDDIKELNKQSRKQSKARGDGLLGRMGAGLTATMKSGELFIGLDINEALRRYPNTVQVPANTVSKLRISNQGVDYNYYDLKIKAAGYNEKYRFTDYDKRDHQALKNLLGNSYNSTTHFL